MHIELVESLRCPQPHDDTWLVASVTRFDGREIVEGVLGCPVCRRQYPVRRGEVDFSEGRPAEATSTVEPGAESTSPPSDEDVLRARALLSLDDAGGIVLLGGALARFAHSLADEAQVAPLLFNVPAWAWREGDVPSAIRSRDGLPVARGALRAAWLDAGTATPRVLADAAAALRAGGRLMAPATVPLPEGVRRLAADEEHWVAEATAAPSPPVELRRR